MSEDSSKRVFDIDSPDDDSDDSSGSDDEELYTESEQRSFALRDMRLPSERTLAKGESKAVKELLQVHG
ncbi:hypothetical protein E8E14_000701 [Neopestalotiopsis sp. 37M]|nr:hypothetical protein E8E14_000701 [Neopestalotiopsis sp. 37M]